MNTKYLTGSHTFECTTGKGPKNWDILIEVRIQDQIFKGVITARAGDQQTAEKLAKRTMIDGLRRIGIWANTSKKDEKILYHAPTYEHVNVLGIGNFDEYGLTYPESELEKAKEIDSYFKSTTKKRRTPNEKALADRKKKQRQITKKEKRQEKQQAKAQNKIDKQELLQKVLEYFLGETPKKIKTASNELEIQYQKVRYALFLLRDKGLDDKIYNLIETEIDGNKAFRLEKK